MSDKEYGDAIQNFLTTGEPSGLTEYEQENYKKMRDALLETIENSEVVLDENNQVVDLKRTK